MQMLSNTSIQSILDQSFEILCKKGIMYENSHAVKILSDHGAQLNSDGTRVCFPRDVIERLLKNTCHGFKLFDAYGQQTHDLKDNNVHYAPGSSALNFLHGANNTYRRPVTNDYVDYVKVIEQLPAIAAQSTAFIPGDVPEAVADSYRLFLSLLFSRKAVVTGVFKAESFTVMRDLLLAVRKTEAHLKALPLGLFSCCPTSPLKWSNVTAQNLIDCATHDIPIEIIAMPLAGFIAPVTLMGTIIQHTVETLSGILLAQAVRPGAPILYGGSPAIFDVRHQTTPMGAIETMMIDCAYNEIGKSLNMPTQAYIGLSDAKELDVQAGLETGMGATLAVLAGINSISGPGMLDFENCFSLEKLVVDHEICAMSLRLVQGVSDFSNDPMIPLIDEVLSEGHLLTSEHTMTYLKNEHIFPANIIERKNRNSWVDEGQLSASQRAESKVAELINSYELNPLDAATINDLFSIMRSAAKLHGLDNLPLDNFAV
jgi:trimethylamine--corrinoid protein Co-methyltransferase